jgi:hypothetical protein
VLLRKGSEDETPFIWNEFTGHSGIWPTQLRTPLLHYNIHDSSDILSAYPLKVVFAKIYLQLSIPQNLKNLLWTSTEILHVNESKHKSQIQKWNYADVYYTQHWIVLHSTGTTKSSEMKLYLLAVFINISYSKLCTQIIKYKICIQTRMSLWWEIQSCDLIHTV